MTISILLVLYIMAAHWLADFVCQSDKMARGKSSSNYWLSLHVVIYTTIMTVLLLPIIGYAAILYMLVNGILHWGTDYYTSRGSSYFFKKEDYHNGFVVVGVDQWIHLACLLLTTSLFKVGF